MNTVTCPVCGNVSPANAMNCKQCGINLQFALQNPVEVGRIKGNVVTIHNRDEKIEKTLRDLLLRHHPGEELRGYMLGIERPNIWLEALLLGAIVGAVATRSYYVGLTDKRIVLIPLNWWTSRPTDNFSEILLGRITKMEYKRGWLAGNLKIHYGENIKRRLVFNWRQRRNAKNFIDNFELLPKPMLTEEEMAAASAAEVAHRQEINGRIAVTAVVLVLLLFIIFALTFGGRPY
jgi:hypothetical protein